MTTIIQRPFWKKLIENAWKEKNIVWLMGVRRIGKTSLCYNFEGIEHYDCERPRTRTLLADPEFFLDSHRGKTIILDEIHRLDNPSELLKIAADYYKDIKIIATGSSTLGASAKFQDTLTDRKREVWLTPLLLEEMEIFGNTDLRHRFLFGGFPSLFAEQTFPEVRYAEWVDSYWSKDIQELFTIVKKGSFQKFLEMLFVQSGGIFEVSKFAEICEVSRPTIENYLTILEETFVVHIIRPFFTHKMTEIVKAPKVYSFDTGFVAYARGWTQLRQEDTGFMWEHVVLNEMQAHLQTRSMNMKSIHYWRDKRDHEIDFVFKSRSSENVTAIECKFQVGIDDTYLGSTVKNFKAFRQIHPQGQNLVVAANVEQPFRRQYEDLIITFVNAKELIRILQEQ